MAAKNIDKLEGLITDLIKEAHRLRSENKELAGEIKALKKELSSATGFEKKMQVKLDRLGFLEASQKKIGSEKTEIRSKVKYILSELDKMDFV